ncbi:MAG: ABC transporter ATP-binding protein [Rhodoferax sp.]|nr:ABC transporter ATP-binding protein [Rhodoferax sp.]
MQQATSSAPLLVIRGLVVEGRSDQGVSQIIQTMDLTLERGKVLGLIGESGAGKSTLGLAAMGFTRDGCRIAAGSIVFDGTDLAQADENTRRHIRRTRIAYVAQSAAASFNPALRLIDQAVETTVQEGGASRKEAVERAIDLYHRLRLPNPDEIGFRYPHQVSGGQLQRAMTAMALVARPDLIIFDEPTTALDVTTQIGVLTAIRDAVRETGTAAIYISHDLALVAQMADRIMVLRHGQLVEEADTRDMMRAPQKDYTRSLWAVRSFRATPKAQPAPGAQALLSVRAVAASYGKVPILHGVSLDLHKGRTTAIVGESGSGKSTLARVIAGLLPPRAGSVVFEGVALAPDYRQRSPDELRRIQMVVQMPDTALNPRQRVRDIIGRPLTFYLGLKGAAREQRVHDLLAEIELDPALYADRLPSELSGGQKQRVCIARALAAEPSLLLCDEVTSALDQLVAEEMLKLLDRLQRERGLAYLFITHDLATVRAIADDVVVMKDGRVVQAGSRERVFAPPHEPYTELLLSSLPEMDPDWLDKLLDQRSKTALMAD